MGSETLDAGVGRSEQASARRRKLSPGPGLGAKEVAAHQLARIHDATIQLVAEHGYKALRVRDIVSRAEVSTRAFYEHFGSKEDCFLRTYQLISQSASQRLIAAQVGEPDWRKRPRLVFEEFVRELEKEPSGARFALIEIYAAGQVALSHAWEVERNFQNMLAASLSRGRQGIVVPPLIVQGMVAGAAHISRGHLLMGRIAALESGGDELIDWAMSYLDPVATELPMLDAQSVWRDTTLEPVASARGGKEESGSLTGDRALILKAVVKLAGVSGYVGLTVPRVCSAASVSKRKFAAYFDDVENSYLAAIEQRTAEAFAAVARAQAVAGSESGSVYRAIDALADHIRKDPFLVRVCLTDDFPQTPAGLRVKRRLKEAAVEMLKGSPSALQGRQAGLSTEASAGAVWSLLQHHMAYSEGRVDISASLAYLALAPKVGPREVVSAIRFEQGP